MIYCILIDSKVKNFFDCPNSKQKIGLIVKRYYAGINWLIVKRYYAGININHIDIINNNNITSTSNITIIKYNNQHQI